MCTSKVIKVKICTRTLCTPCILKLCLSVCYDSGHYLSEVHNLALNLQLTSLLTTKRNFRNIFNCSSPLFSGWIWRYPVCSEWHHRSLPHAEWSVVHWCSSSDAQSSLLLRSSMANVYVCLILLHNWTTFFPAGTYSGLWGMILVYILRHAFNQYHPAVLVFFH
jgi:hypothetical protein